MKIESSKIQKLTLSELERLDPVSVYIEDIGERSGEITLKCFNKSWTAYWGGCGHNGVANFYLSCDNPYLVNCFSRGIDDTITDYDNLDTWLKRHIVKLRKEEVIDRMPARRLWTDVEDHCRNEEHWLHTESANEICCEVLGEDWWHSLPQIDNGEYTYLTRIVQAVRDALQKLNEETPVEEEAPVIFKNGDLVT